jgi:hypothetical protein
VDDTHKRERQPKKKIGYICCAGLENKCWDERVWDEVWCPIITLRLPVVRYFCFAGERRVLDRSLC